MNPIQIWLHAIRPRTLLLAVATVMLGTALGIFYNSFSPLIFILTFITATILQIISNLANDLGDFIKGTDAARVGQTRTVTAGWISADKMKTALIVTCILAGISGCLLLWFALGQQLFGSMIIYALLGIIAIGAALAYTLGKRPFGYHGLGDIAVFFFFGIVGVCGTCYLQTHTFEWIYLPPAVAMGALATGVLNINNMRDIETDKVAGKKTVAVRLGKRGARLYHTLLIIIAFVTTAAFIYYAPISIPKAVAAISPSLLLFTALAIKIETIKDPAHLDPMLKIHSLFTLIYALSFGALLCLK